MHFFLEQGLGVDVAMESLIRKTYRLRGHEAISIGMIMAGGTMRVAASAGYAAGLGKRDLHKALSAGLAVSGGVLPLAYTFADQPELAARAACSVCATRAFINPWRKPVLDNDRLIRSLRKGPLALDVKTMMSDPRPFFVAVSTPDGERLLLDVKAAKDPFLVLRGAIALPGRLDGKIVRVDGQEIMDQVVLTPDQIEWFVQTLGLTDVIFSPNRSELPLPREIAQAVWHEQLGMLPPLFFDLLVRTLLLRGFSHRYRQHASQLRQMFQDGLEWLIFNDRIRLAILPLPVKAAVGNLTTNRKKLQRAVFYAEREIANAYSVALRRLANPSVGSALEDTIVQRYLTAMRGHQSRGPEQEHS